MVKRLRWEHRRFRQRRFMAGLRRRGVRIGPGALVARGADIKPETDVEIGAGTNIHRNCVLKGKDSISIGKYCEIAEGVHIISSNHAVNRANLNLTVQLAVGAGRLFYSKGPVVIGHNVWIGDNAIVLSGVVVGDGAVIGAGAVVTGDVPPFTIVAGSPARPVRKRFGEEVIELLQEIKWWDWSEEQMQDNRDFFAADLTSEHALGLLIGLRSNKIAESIAAPGGGDGR